MTAWLAGSARTPDADPVDQHLRPVGRLAARLHRQVEDQALGELDGVAPGLRSERIGLAVDVRGGRVAVPEQSVRVVAARVVGATLAVLDRSDLRPPRRVIV